MLSLGPIPMAAVFLVVAVAIASFVAWVTARMSGQKALRLFGTFFDMLVVSLVAARLAFVLQHLPFYRADPWSIIRPGDGGYALWAGLLAGVAFGVWQARRHEALRWPLAAGTLAGLAAWGVLASSIALMQRTQITLPDVQLTALDGGSTNLSGFTGQPTVVNLWASWCPPCRREMPALAHAQAAHTQTHFVFVNQGEGETEVRSYLADESLKLRNVMLDPFSSVSRELGARGLPITLFFDRNGRLVDSHMGELTAASLAHKLKRFDLDADPG